MQTCSVVIPVYKVLPNEDELISYSRCLFVLREYDIVIVSHKELDLSFYINYARQYGKEISDYYFDKYYFKGISGYNLLMYTNAFYKRFINSEYILIYQLDAYVFSDQLKFWCSGKYIYIGAPILREDINQKKIYYGCNGGFSLRKINEFLTIYETNWYRKYVNVHINQTRAKWLGYLKIPCFLVAAFIAKHNIRLVLPRSTKQEDQFWSDVFTLPPLKEASNFSLEKEPSYWYKENQGILPFGCHAWEKYEKTSFWMKHIEGIKE